MNAEGRKAIQTIIDMLQGISLDDTVEQLDTLADEEQGKFDNLSEGLQAAERGQKLEAAASALSSAKSSLESAKGDIESAISELETAVE
jgi:hypothetical protein